MPTIQPADLKMTVNLPSEGFETYYLKVDPRVKDYVKEIKLYRADGSSYTIDDPKAVWAANENAKSWDGQNGYWRINLLDGEPNYEAAKRRELLPSSKRRAGRERGGPKKQRFVFLLTSRNTRRSEA